MIIIPKPIYNHKGGDDMGDKGKKDKHKHDKQKLLKQEQERLRQQQKFEKK